MVVGGAIIPLLRFDPHAVLSAIERHRATFLMGVPTMTIAMMEQAKTQSYDRSSLTAVHSAAAPTPSWVWRDIQQTFGCDETFTSYGLTETTIVCTRPGDPIEVVAETQGCIVEAGVAGIPEWGGRIAEFKTIDPETDDDLPVGAADELCTRGPMNSQGYFRRPDDSDKLFLPGGWIRTGDLGQFRADGNLFQLVTSHPAVAQAFFIGMPDERWGECGCAWIVPADGEAATAEAVTAWLAGRVAGYKLPRDIWFIADAELPKTGTDKVQKKVLKEMALARFAGKPDAG